MFISHFVRRAALAATLAVFSANLFAVASPHPRSLPTSVIYEYAPGTWLENLAVRSNGDVLVSALDRPDMYMLHQSSNGTTSTLITDLQDAGVHGFLAPVETKHDVFAVITGQFNFTTLTPTEGSFAIWSVDVRNFPKRPAKVFKITDIPEAGFLNGMARLGDDEDVLLVGDCAKGTVYRLNVETAEYEVVLQDDSMKPGNKFPAIGIDGIITFSPPRSQDLYLYYTNYIQNTFYRVLISPQTGKALGPYELVAANIFGDDLAMTKDGTAYIAAGPTNTIVKVSYEGAVDVVINGTIVQTATAVKFGRSRDRGEIFITTGTGKVVRTTFEDLH